MLRYNYIAALGKLVMSYVNRLTLALKHCKASLRRLGTRPSCALKAHAANDASWNEPCSDTKLTRVGAFLGKGVVYSFALSVALTTVGLSAQTACADSWHKRPQGFVDNSTISEIQSHSCDDQKVQIRGRLTNYLYKDCYEFTDELGNSIAVELDDDIDWSPVHKDQLIDIFGEVERNLFKISIDAKGYRILEEAPQIAAAQAAPANVAPAAAPAPAPAIAAPAPVPATAVPEATKEPAAPDTPREDSSVPVEPETTQESPAQVESSLESAHLSVNPESSDVRVERISYES